ncbi:MAG: hypothetical protein WC359_13230 [Dehalococcoidia bacterium]|jgi:hypothetical protein
MELQFRKYDNSHSKLVAASLEAYYTGGNCTHIAEAEFGEIILVFPRSRGERFLLIINVADQVEFAETGMVSGNEFFVNYTDKQLEAGVEVSTSFF